MTDEVRGSTVPRRQLGRYLTQLRTDAGVTVECVAAALACSRQKVWRIERGVSPVRGPELATMCELYRVPPPMAEVLRGRLPSSATTTPR